MYVTCDLNEADREAHIPHVSIVYYIILYIYIRTTDNTYSTHQIHRFDELLIIGNYTHIHTYRERETDRQTDRQTLRW